MLARVARRASLTLRRRRTSSKFDASTFGNHFHRESVSSVNYIDDKLGTPKGPFRRESNRPSFLITREAASTDVYDDTDLDGEETEKVVQLTEAHRTAIRVIRKIKYFVARRKFQQARKPYDVRDVIEQYSQGHLNMMVRLKELQRRLDQTLGKPSTLYTSTFREKEKQTISARMIRVENQVHRMDQKIDRVITLLNTIVKSEKFEENKEQKRPCDPKV